MGWSTSSIRLLGDRLLVRLHPRHVEHGRIYIADDLRRHPQSADVFAVGPGLWAESGVRIPRDVQAGTDDRPGDVVVLGKWNGVALEDPDDHPGSSLPNDPRWYVLESAAQKLRREGSTMSIEFDDFYFVARDAVWGQPLREWRVREAEAEAAQ